MRYFLVFTILLMIIGVNIPGIMLARLGIDASYLLVALIAWVITGLIIHRRLALIVVVIMLAVGANLPTAIADHMGIDRDYLTATLVVVVLAPYVMTLFD